MYLSGRKSLPGSLWQGVQRRLATAAAATDGQICFWQDKGTWCMAVERLCSESFFCVIIFCWVFGGHNIAKNNTKTIQK